MMKEEETEKRIVSGNSSDDEKNAELTLRPTRLSEYIGQQQVKDNLSISIKAAMQRGEQLD
ncbi:MAG TPA: Holliday junction branch migration DNA helicase RuvB, partial [bacterium]|nr:Holliday junction branch migration DNA helicase RuvB [bacterium]